MDEFAHPEEESNDEGCYYTTEIVQRSYSPSQEAIVVSGKPSGLPVAMLNDEESSVIVSSSAITDVQGTDMKHLKLNSCLLREMFKYKEQVKILPLLLGVAGFMESSTAKNAIQQMLEINDADFPEGFSSHHLIATKDYRLAFIDSTLQSIYNYSIQSCKSVASKHIDTKLVTGSKFEHNLLDDYMEKLLVFLKNNSQNNTKGEAKIIASIAKGRIALFKVWNISFNTNVLYFLRRFTDHLTQLRLWLFTDFEELEKGLPVAQEEGSIKLWFTCLHYLLRSVKVCNGAAHSMNEQKPCRVFVSLPDNSRILTEEVIEKIKKLEENLSDVATQLKVKHCLKEKVVTFDSSSKCHSNLKELLLSDTKLIPLSMLFLRGALENHDQVFIKKTELNLLAEKCEINVNDFCKFFTSFGSIFDLSLVQPNSDSVIIKPDIFLAKINEVFDVLDTNNDSQYICNGILTPSLVEQLFGADGYSYMTVLSDVGMCAVIKPGKFMNRNELNDQVCYYMPCARKVKQNQDTDNKTTVHLLLDVQRPPNFLNYEVFFTNFILCNSHLNGYLLSSEYENVTLLKHFGDNTDEYVNTSISYRGSHVEIAINTSLRLLSFSLPDHIKCIISAVEHVAETSTDKKGRFTYGFAVVCSLDGEHHVLPDELCSTCARNKCFQAWTRALTEKPIKEEFKFKSEITLDDATFLAQAMQSYDKDLLIHFGRELGDEDTVYEEFKSFPWAYLLTVLTKWMTRGPVTKADLARKVLSLSINTTKDAASLKELARRLFQRVIKESNTVTTKS